MKIVNLVSSNGLEYVSGFISNEEYADLLATGWTLEPVVEDVDTV